MFRCFWHSLFSLNIYSMSVNLRLSHWSAQMKRLGIKLTPCIKRPKHTFHLQVIRPNRPTHNFPKWLESHPRPSSGESHHLKFGHICGHLDSSEKNTFVPTKWHRRCSPSANPEIAHFPCKRVCHRFCFVDGRKSLRSNHAQETVQTLFTWIKGDTSGIAAILLNVLLETHWNQTVTITTDDAKGPPSWHKTFEPLAPRFQWNRY